MAQIDENAAGPADALDLRTLPPIFVSATHFVIDDLHKLEEDISEANATLTYDIREAKIVLSKVTRKARIQFDLRTKGLWTEEVEANVGAAHTQVEPATRKHRTPISKRTKGSRPESAVGDDSSTASEVDEPQLPHTTAVSGDSKTGTAAGTVHLHDTQDVPTWEVVRVDWFTDSKAAGHVLPLDDYISYVGREIAKPSTPTPTTATKLSPAKYTSPSKGILERAKEDAPPSDHARRDRFGKRKFNAMSKSSVGASWEAGHGPSQRPTLIHTTTSDQEGSSSDLPEMPDWVKQGIKYACQRSSPRDNPNKDFMQMLETIKLARLLTNDEIGVRAYSTSIASLAAYPHRLSQPKEILALPGCDNKIANLFVEWKNTGTLQAVEDINANEDLKVLKLFFDIWGVGATTAREFYYEKGWRDLDDIVEQGWTTLSRVQQIGLKYYEEFLDPIPRVEVERIGRIIHEHAVRVRDERIQTLIVGGHRRGKEASGDVDIIVSHPDEDLTLNVVNDIVASLEDEGWVTHTLLLSLNSTNRNQQTLPFRSGKSGGHGFDTLDKALVVWQDPSWPTQDADLAANPKAKNPNIHRRVDIIVSPWRTVGCAVLGWSGGTTFQRDVRRYVKYVKGWKFDSSGVRSRGNGEVVDLEGWNGYHGNIGTGRAKTMEEAEKRVFEGLDLVYRPPSERWTG